MASSYSTLNNYSNFSVFNFDHDLIIKAMGMKQGTIDNNREKLLSIRDQLGQFDIVKDVDKKYFDERVDKSLSIVKKYAGGDLSDPNLMTQLQGKLQEVVDDKVLNAVSAPYTRRNELAEWSANKAKDPSKYSDLNYAYSQQNWNNYLKSDQVGEAYRGGGGFIEFDDVNARLASKETNEILKNANIQYIKREDGSGYFSAINSYEAVDPNRLSALIEGIIGEKGKMQLQINAWGRYGNGDNQQVVESVKSQFDSRISADKTEAETRLSAINTALKGKLSEGDRARYEADKSRMERSIQSLEGVNFNTSVANADGTLDPNKYKSIYTSLYVDEFQKNAFNMHYFDPIWKDTKINDIEYKTVTFEESKRHNLATEFNTQQRTMWDMQGKPLMDENGNYVLDANGNRILTASGAKNSTNTSINSSPTNVSLGTNTIITKEELPEIKIRQEYQKDYQNTISIIRQSAGNNWDENSTISLEKHLINGVPAIGQIIQLDNGRKLIVDGSNVVALENLKAMVDGDNGSIRSMRNNLKDFKNSYSSVLSQEYKSNPNQFNNVNLGNFYFEQDSEGNLLYKQGTLKGSSGNNFRYLVDKKNRGIELTTTEQKTMDLYETKAMLADENTGLTTIEKQQLYRAYKSENNSKTNNSLPSFDNMSVGVYGKKEIKVVPRSQIGWGSYLPTQNFVEISEEESKTIPSEFVRKGRTPETKDKFYITYAAAKNLRNNTSQIDIDVSVPKTAYQSKMTSVYEQTRGVLQRSDVVISQKSFAPDKATKSQEEQLAFGVASAFGLPHDYTGRIRIVPVIENGIPRDIWKAVIEKTVSKDGTKNFSKEDWIDAENIQYVKGSRLRELGVNIGQPSFSSPFDANLGDEAQSIKLVGGSGLYSQGALLTQQGGGSKYYQSTVANGFRGYYSPETRTELDAVQSAIRVKTGNPNFDLYESIKNTKGTPVDLTSPEITIQNVNGKYSAVDQFGNVFLNTGLTRLTQDDILNIKSTADQNLRGLLIQQLREIYGI